MKTISKISMKKYKCKNCGHVKSLSTNHYGECYGHLGMNLCEKCSWKRPGKAVTWECQEKPPKGMALPSKWKSAAIYFCKKCEKKTKKIDDIDGYCKECLS